jgi:hypothetical protein
MSTKKPESASPVYRRGLIARSGFVLFILAPSLVLSILAWCFCMARHKPVLLVPGVMIACFFVVDYFAYHVFCEIAVEPGGLLYRGGGVFWKRLRKGKALPWSNYVYLVQATRKGYYAGLRVLDEHKRDALWWLPLWAPARDGAYPEFRSFVREILIYNPEVKTVFVDRARRSTRGVLRVWKEGIQIAGDRDFVRRTIDALEILKARDPVNYRRVRKYIHKIDSVQSKSLTNLETATFEVSELTAFGDDAKWYASTIVHEMCHCILHQRFRFSWYNPHNRRKHEEICSRAQLRSLERIGGSESQLEYLEKGFKRRLSELYPTEGNE